MEEEEAEDAGVANTDDKEGEEDGGETSHEGNVKKTGYCSLVLVKETMAKRDD